MVHSNIIKEYTCTLDNWSIEKTYRDYFCNELRANVDTLLRNMEEAKGISNINHTEDAMKQIDQKIMEIYHICEFIMVTEENEEG